VAFSITQSSRDIQILFYIQRTLGFGYVTPSQNAKYRIRNREDLLKIIEIFNGNLYTNKRKIQFKLWLEAFNLKYKEEIQFKDCQLKPTLTNAWLSGFTDAEGCFTVSLLYPDLEKNPQIHVRFMLAQENEHELMEAFVILLKGQAYDGRKLTVGLSNLNNVIAYFTAYPLKTKKAKDFALCYKFTNLL
jgi:hypothetical protein